MTRIIIADDHTLFRIGLKQMLESFDGVTVVAEAANAAQTLAVVQGVAADLLDLRPDHARHRRHAADRAAAPATPGAADPDPEHARRAGDGAPRAAGRRHRLPDQGVFARHMLQAAVRQVAAGERFIPPALAETLAFEIDPPDQPAA
jgi:DNA-binding NarL/FixJ family response regulator